MKKFYFILSFIFVVNTSFAQSTFESVYNLFQANCTVSCHSGATPAGQLNLAAPIMDVYADLINVTPGNFEAASKGYKQVDPGYPERSFLFRKVAHDIDPDRDYLTIPMGNPMPDGQAAMDHDEIELIRQWILYGAGDTNETYLDPQILEDFYGGMGLPRVEAPDAPNVNEGFQLHYGPFFLEPLAEKEFMYKYDTKLPVTKEIYRVNTKINEESHHTALYRYHPQADSLIKPGLRQVNGLLDAAQVFFASDILGQWPNDQNLVLPEGLAFTFPQNCVLDLNYHILNYSSDSILAAEFYMNVYTQDEGTAEAELLSLPVYYGGQEVFNLIIPPGDSTFVIEQFETDTAYSIYLWSIMAHTHQFGTSFDVWTRDSLGGKDEHIYNGNYDPTYTFLTPSYDWQHAPFRTFDPLKEIDMTKGLIHEASFHNPGTENIVFGLTNDDEMFVTYLQYAKIPLTDDTGEKEIGFGYFNAYPNPTKDQLTLSFTNNADSDGFVSIFDNMGREIYSKSYSLKTGVQKIQLSKSELGISAGMYSVRLSTHRGNKVTKVVFE